MPTFCDRCGAPLGADDQRCRTCGWPVSAPPPPGRGEPPAEGGEHDVATRVQPAVTPPVTSEGPATARVEPPVAPEGPATAAVEPAAGHGSPYARPTAPVPAAPTPAAAEDDPYAGWFVDDEPAQPAAAAGAWTAYDADERAGAWDQHGWEQYDDDPRLPPPLREDEPLELDGGARRSGAGRVIGALAVGAVIVLVGLAAIYLGVLRHDGGAPAAAPSSSAAAPPGSTVSGTRSASASSAPSSSATSTSAYPPVSISGKECGASGSGPWSKAAAGNGATSCPFALAVQQAWLATNPQPGDTKQVQATSPVTGKTYPMSCAGDQPVTCQGGNGAVVYLYGGTASFG